MRSATENVAGFVGFGAAADIARKESAEETPCLKQFREHISRELSRAVPHSLIYWDIQLAVCPAT